MGAYEAFLTGTMADLEFPEAELREAMAQVPELDPV